jgi:TRAP-type transport system periplasmic protein
MRILSLAVAAFVIVVARGAAADETVLRFVPGTSPPVNETDVANFYRQWADKVTADSHGALKIDLRYGAAIATPANMYYRVLNSVVQIGFVLFNYAEGKFPLAEVAALPDTADSAADGSRALWRLYESGALGTEFDDAIPLMLVALPQSLVHLRSAPKSLENLDGLRIIGPTQMTALASQSMGAQILTIPSPDAYEAISRGTADGTILSWNVYFTFKIGEITHYHIDQSMGTAAGMIFMSRKVYDALPPAAKAAIEANSGETVSAAFGGWWDRDNARNRALAKQDPKQTVVDLSPEMKAKWQERLAGADADWMRTRPGVEKVLAQYKRDLADIAAGH